MSKAKKMPQTLKKTDLSERNAPDIVRYEQTDPVEGYRFVVIENTNKDNSYMEEMTYKQMVGMQILEPYCQIGERQLPDILTIEEKKYKFNVPPGHTKCVVIRCDVQMHSMSAQMARNVVPYVEPVEE